MKRAKYIIPFFLGTFVYILVSICFGQNSVQCYKKMEEQKRLISIQTSSLQDINTELQMEVTALKNDKAVMSAYARKLDYVSNDEKIVKINGLKPVLTTLYDTGSVLKHKDPEFLPEKYCKIIALFISLVSFVLLLLYDLSKGNLTFSHSKKSDTLVAGIPVYDLPQV